MIYRAVGLYLHYEHVLAQPDHKLNSFYACLQIGGDITYNGKTFKDFVIERTSGYVQQNDQHYAPLWVQACVFQNHLAVQHLELPGSEFPHPQPGPAKRLL